MVIAGRGGSRYIDSVVLRDRDLNGGGGWTGAGDGTLEEGTVPGTSIEAGARDRRAAIRSEEHGSRIEDSAGAVALRAGRVGVTVPPAAKT